MKKYDIKIPMSRVNSTHTIIDSLIDCKYDIHPLETMGNYAYFSKILIYDRGYRKISIASMLKAINDKQVWTDAINLMNSSRLSYSKQIKEFRNIFYRYISNTTLFDVAVDLYYRSRFIYRDTNTSNILLVYTHSILANHIETYRAVLYIPRCILKLKFLSPSISRVLGLISSNYYSKNVNLTTINDQAYITIKAYSEEDLIRTIDDITRILMQFIIVIKRKDPYIVYNGKDYDEMLEILCEVSSTDELTPKHLIIDELDAIDHCIADKLEKEYKNNTIGTIIRRDALPALLPPPFISIKDI